MNIFPSTSTVLARLGVAFCFITFGIWELQNPQMWSTYVPSYMSAIASLALLVQIHAAVIIVTALGLLSGWWPRVWSLIATLSLAELCFIVFEGEGFSDIFVRDISLLLFSAGLTAHEWQAAKKA